MLCFQWKKIIYLICCFTHQTFQFSAKYQMKQEQIPEKVEAACLEYLKKIKKIKNKFKIANILTYHSTLLVFEII